MKVPTYIFATILKPGRRNRSRRPHSWPRRLTIVVLRVVLAIVEGA